MLKQVSSNMNKFHIQLSCFSIGITLKNGWQRPLTIASQFTYKYSIEHLTDTKFDPELSDAGKQAQY
jgi:hypothetical protein